MATRRACLLGLFTLIVGTAAMADDIRDVKTRHAAQLMQLPGVVSVGIGQDADSHPVIIVGLDRATEANKARIPESLEGFRVIAREIGTVKAQ